MARNLIVGDIHAPVAHPGYLYFCQDVREKYKCDNVILIGDVVDWHAISFHAKHPDAPGPNDEHELALEEVQKWYRTFRKARVCIGNHDARVIRTAEEAGIPSKFIRSYAETWETPNWEWADEFKEDDVYYFHGTGTGGIHPAFTTMGKMLMSVVQGHIHSAGGIKWRANPQRRIFAMDTGCGIDDRAYAFAYGHAQKVRSILSAGVVIDGIPHHEIMPIGPGEKYHRSNFTTGVENAKTVVPVPARDPSGDITLSERVCAQGSPAGDQRRAEQGENPVRRSHGKGQGGGGNRPSEGHSGRRQGGRKPGNQPAPTRKPNRKKGA